MPRNAVLTCPNCHVKIEYVTLHRGKVLGWHHKRERDRSSGAQLVDAIYESKTDSPQNPQTGE